MSVHRLSGNAAASVISVIVYAFILFEIYRLLISEVGANQVGVWSLLMASVAIARIAEFGLGGSVARFVAKDLGAGMPDSAASLIGVSGIATAFLVGLCCLAMAFVIPAVLTRALPTTESIELATRLLPYALLSIWCTVVGHIFASALDGMQRTVARSYSLSIQGLTQLGFAHLLVPQYGLLGMAIANLSGIALHLAISLTLVVTILRRPLRDWFSLSRARALEILRFGGRVQLSTIAVLLFDPVVKWSLGIFGGLALTAYYEMANRAVNQLRMVIVSAYEMLIPYYSHRLGSAGLDVGDLRSTYSLSLRLIVLVSAPFFAVVALTLPVLSLIWLGEYREDFYRISVICLLGWSISTLSVPAIMFYTALGDLRWTMFSHVSVALLNGILATIGGVAFGGMGVVSGAMTALVLGNLVVITAFHRTYELSWRLFCPKGFILIISASSIPASWLGAHFAREGELALAIVPLLTLLPVFIHLLWRHPLILDARSHLLRFRDAS